MSRQHHHLKTETEYYQAIERGDKKFELRFNDREFKKYDMIYLEETVNGVYTGRKLDPFEIQYIFYGGKYGLDENYCIFSLPEF
jgi:ASC-1-like (ASCH) protein